MSLQLFLNELSVPTEPSSRPVSVGRLKQLVATVREARGIDEALILNSEISLSILPLAEGTTIASVRNDGECVEESLFLKTINNRCPLKLAAIGAGEHDPDLCDYRLPAAAALRAGEVAAGLGFAHLLDGLGLSLASHDYWREHSIELDLASFNADGEFVTTVVTARNAESPAAIVHHAEALRALLAPTIRSGEELWRRRAELLPNLVFIPRTRGQLEDILPGDPMLDQAWIKLRGIDRAITSWKVNKGPFPMFPFNVRPESRSRRALVAFNDDDGNQRIFSQHCDLTPTEARIHFIVETDPRPHALIGHVGRKLGIG